MPNINYLSLKPDTPAEGYWDMEFIDDLMSSLPNSDREVFVIPGSYQGYLVEDINIILSKSKQVLVFVTSDEEGKFPVEKLRHPDMVLFVQYKGTFPLGYTPQAREELKKLGFVKKDIPWFFAGQINHVRRRQMQEVLVDFDYSHRFFFPSDGFSRGLPPKDYFEMMAHARAIPCPPGNVTQDSFRVYEALEAGCVPVVDRFSAQGEGDYWERMFPRGVPFPIISSYRELPEAIDRAQDPMLRLQTYAWWIRKKMTIRQQMKEILDINEAMTVIVPTSPIPSHPSTEIIDKTIASIRKHTAMDIILTIDGVRPEQEHMREKYMEYVQHLLWKCNFEYEHVLPLLFEDHVHQSGMIREALKWVHTPLLMYVEHDTPLVTDEEIDWADVSMTILQGKAHVVRFHFESQIPQEHEYLMLHEKDMPGYIATKQWSQRPHVARTDFYRDIMQFFSPQANCFIEDLIYGKCVEGNPDDWKVYIYAPKGNIKRSLNLDGRAGDVKYDDRQLW